MRRAIQFSLRRNSGVAVRTVIDDQRATVLCAEGGTDVQRSKSWTLYLYRNREVHEQVYGVLYVCSVVQNTT